MVCREARLVFAKGPKYAGVCASARGKNYFPCFLRKG